MLAVLEANHHFYEYYKPYIHSEWKVEYFAYDHFKHLYKIIKSKEQYYQSPEIFQDIQLQCYEEIKRVHKFIATVIREIDTDLSAVNDMLGTEGIESNPSILRVSIAASGFTDTAHFDPHEGEEDDDAEHRGSQRKVSFAHSTASYGGQSPSEFRRTRTISRSLQPILGMADEEQQQQRSSNLLSRSQHSQIQALQKAASANPSDPYRDRSIELALRNIYTRTKEIDKFYQLNYFVIRKISKKIDKLIKIGKFHQHMLQTLPPVMPASTTEPSADAAVIAGNSTKEDEILRETDASISGGATGSGKNRPRGSSASVVGLQTQSIANSTTATLVSALMGNASEDYLKKLLKEGSPHDDHRGGSTKTISGPPVDVESGRTQSNSDHSIIPLIKGWKETISGAYFYDEFIGCREVIDEMKNECVAIYTKKFRKTYNDLAVFELEYAKERDRVDKTTNLFVGLKLGLIVCMVSSISLFF